MIENNLSRIVAAARFNALRRWTHKAALRNLPEPANGSPPGDAPADDAPPDAPTGGEAFLRAKIYFSIPAYTFTDCACGRRWIGLAHAFIDERGYFWHCPGCHHLFCDAGEAPGDQPPPEDGAP